MNGPFRKTIEKIQAYVPGEQPRDRRTVKLNTNENPYPPSPRVIEALSEAVDDRLRLYPRPMADDLRERAARVYGVRPEQVLVGNGSDELLTLLVRAVVDRGTRVAWPVPTYSLYETLVELQEGEAVRIPFGEDWTLPEALIAAEARLVFLANPNSPSGSRVPAADVARLLERADRLVVVDEAYADFADGNCLALLATHPNLVVLRTFSKSFSLAGMRIGLALSSPRVITALTKAKDSYNVNRLSIVAGEAALRDVRWMETNVRRIQKSRAELTLGLEALGFLVVPSQSNFVMARRPGRSLGPVYETLRRRGILVRWFDSPELQDSLRITVGTDEEIGMFLRVLRGIVEREEA